METDGLAQAVAGRIVVHGESDTHAIAAALQQPPDAVQRILVGFSERRWIGLLHAIGSGDSWVVGVLDDRALTRVAAGLR